MFARLVRVLALLFLVAFVARLVLILTWPFRRRRAAAARANSRGRMQSPHGQPDQAERLVRDPICGVRLPESRAVLDHGRHFCSRECADRFALVPGGRSA